MRQARGFTWALQQHGQHLEGLRWESELQSLLAQFAGFEIGLEHPEADDLWWDKLTFRHDISPSVANRGNGWWEFITGSGFHEVVEYG